MVRPIGSGGDLRARRAEWSLVRKTALLGDVVDEYTFRTMLGITLRSFRHYHSDGEVYGIPFPVAIARPEGLKPIWLTAEVERFAGTFKGARASRGRKP